MRPFVSPERYAWDDNNPVSRDSLAGSWERIVLGYNVVPGYGNEQFSPNLQVSTDLTLAQDGTVSGFVSGNWVYTAPWLQITRGDGGVEKLLVQHGRDWENKKNTFIFTGLDNAGTAIWGKRNKSSLKCNT